jgi:hypothetical protein
MITMIWHGNIVNLLLFIFPITDCGVCDLDMKKKRGRACEALQMRRRT